MVNLKLKTMSLATFISVVLLVGVGVTAWVDVKSDVRENATNIENSKDRENRIESKVDQIYLLLIDINKGDNNDSRR